MGSSCPPVFLKLELKLYEMLNLKCVDLWCHFTFLDAKSLESVSKMLLQCCVNKCIIELPHTKGVTLAFIFLNVYLQVQNLHDLTISPSHIADTKFWNLINQKCYEYCRKKSTIYKVIWKLIKLAQSFILLLLFFCNCYCSILKV